MFTHTNHCRMNVSVCVHLHTNTFTYTHLSSACSLQHYIISTSPSSLPHTWAAGEHVWGWEYHRNDITVAVASLRRGAAATRDQSSQWQPGGEALTVPSSNRSAISTAQPAAYLFTHHPEDPAHRLGGIHPQATCIYSWGYVNSCFFQSTAVYRNRKRLFVSTSCYKRH